MDMTTNYVTNLAQDFDLRDIGVDDLGELDAKGLKNVAMVVKMATLLRGLVKDARGACPPGQVRGKDGKCQKVAHGSGFLRQTREREEMKDEDKGPAGQPPKTPDASGDMGKAAAWELGVVMALEKLAIPISAKGAISFLRGGGKISPTMASNMGIGSERLGRYRQAASRLNARSAGASAAAPTRIRGAVNQPSVASVRPVTPQQGGTVGSRGPRRPAPQQTRPGVIPQVDLRAKAPIQRVPIRPVRRGPGGRIRGLSPMGKNVLVAGGLGAAGYGAGSNQRQA